MFSLASAQTVPWTVTWSVAPQQTTIASSFNNLAQQTLRQAFQISIGGSSVRVRISNTYGVSALAIQDVHIAETVAANGGNPTSSTIPGTDHAVTWGGSTTTSIPAGQTLASDVVDMQVTSGENLMVSIYFPAGVDSANSTYHQLGGQNGMFLAAGDVSANTSISTTSTFSSYFYLTDVDVQNSEAIGTLVALGASITDGYATAFNTNNRWTNDLAVRMNDTGVVVGVSNKGISGNQELVDGAGQSALNRFERDVVSQPNVRWVIYSDDPINDLDNGNGNGDPSYASLIAGVEQMISEAHAAGIKFYCSTLTPNGGRPASEWTPSDETIREEIDAFYFSGTSGCDGIVDQASATSNPTDPLEYLPAYNSGDSLHPNDAGYLAISYAVNLGLFTPYFVAPFNGGVAAIPGTVQAENYDLGGQGVGYSVSSVNGTGNSYRSDGVDLEATSDTGGGYDLGWTTSEQWFDYTVDVVTAGTYTVSFRVAAPSAVVDAFHISNASGTDLSGPVNIPATGGWQTWTTVTASVTLPEAEQVLTLIEDNGGWNINYATFASATPAEGPYGGTPAAIPGTVKAENYDTGGQGIGYNVSSTNGTDNAYRSDGVDLETATAPATSNDLGWTTSGQWFRYTVNVTTAGTYTVSFLVAGDVAVTDAFHLSNSSGTNLSGSINVPDTGGWQAWTTVTATVTLPAGTQTLTLDEDNGGWNIDTATFAQANAPFGGTPAAIPGTVMAENYDTGGQGVGYNITSVNGTDDAYRSDGVDLETATAPATGNDLGWTATGQWFKYTVNVATAGTYAVSFLVAGDVAVADALHLSNSAGTNLTGSVAVPSTGGWQDWTTVTATVTLPAGIQTLTLNEDNAGWNIDTATFAVQ
jgi:lysophospholipase L1-like esterase